MHYILEMNKRKVGWDRDNMDRFVHEKSAEREQSVPIYPSWADRSSLRGMGIGSKRGQSVGAGQ